MTSWANSSPVLFEPGYALLLATPCEEYFFHHSKGYAITTVKIEGIDHEFSTYQRKEDVTKSSEPQTGQIKRTVEMQIMKRSQ